MKYIFELLQMSDMEYNDMRLSDILSVLKLLKIDHDPVELENAYSLLNSPLLMFESKSDATLIIRILETTFTIKNIYLFINEKPNLDSAIDSLKIAQKKIFFENTSFSLNIKFFGRKFKNCDRLDIIKKAVAKLHISGEIDLETPQRKFFILGHRKKSHDDFSIILAKKLGAYKKNAINHLSLKERLFIGPTSTDVRLSILMANQAGIKRGDLIYDPFVGTGSILITAAYRGAFVIGSDIDMSILKGKEKLGKKTMFLNFAQYELKPPEVFRMDFSEIRLRQAELFDAIVCDPPYGVRAGAKRVCKCDKVLIPKNKPHFTKMEGYSLTQLEADLMEFAAEYLKIGGKLVLLHPLFKEPFERIRSPSHYRLKESSASKQKLYGRCDRLLLTFEKTE